MLKHIQPWARPGTIAFLIIMIIMVLSYIASAIWGADDVREWISAYSGWAGVVAVLVAVFIQLAPYRVEKKMEILEKRLSRDKLLFKAIETAKSKLVHEQFSSFEVNVDPSFASILVDGGRADLDNKDVFDNQYFRLIAERLAMAEQLIWESTATFEDEIRHEVGTFTSSNPDTLEYLGIAWRHFWDIHSVNPTLEPSKKLETSLNATIQRIYRDRVDSFVVKRRKVMQRSHDLRSKITLLENKLAD